MILLTTIGAVACPVSNRRISVGIWELLSESGRLLQKRAMRPLNLPLRGCLLKGTTSFQFLELNDVDT